MRTSSFATTLTGDPTPSDADRRLARKIREAGQIVEI
jgi:DNA repair protein RadC